MLWGVSPRFAGPRPSTALDLELPGLAVHEWVVAGMLSVPVAPSPSVPWQPVAACLTTAGSSDPRGPKLVAKLVAKLLSELWPVWWLLVTIFYPLLHPRGPSFCSRMGKAGLAEVVSRTEPPGLSVAFLAQSLAASLPVDVQVRVFPRLIRPL